MDTGGWATINSVVDCLLVPYRYWDWRPRWIEDGDWKDVVRNCLLYAATKGKPSEKSRFEIALWGTEDQEQPAVYEDQKWQRFAVRVIQGHTIRWINERRTGAILTTETMGKLPYMVHGTNKNVIGSIMTSGLKADPPRKGGRQTLRSFLAVLAIRQPLHVWDAQRRHRERASLHGQRQVDQGWR